MSASQMVFAPQIIQNGRGPHLHDFAYAADAQGDAFRTDISVVKDGVRVAGVPKGKRFGINVRWNVEGYGFLYMPADNAGDGYEMPVEGTVRLNLNYELARTRVRRLNCRQKTLLDDEFRSSPELTAFLNLANEYLNQAEQTIENTNETSVHAQKALLYGLHASEMLESEYARHAINRAGKRSGFLFGCDARGFFQMDKMHFLDIFSTLFNFATITHYLIGDAVDFEPSEGDKRYTERDELAAELNKREILIEGRPLFWTHAWVTPDWLRKKNFSGLLNYLDEHIEHVFNHYSNRIAIWEVVNELHDWANELQLDHQQTIELTARACSTARAFNPKIKLLINNCCPFADYVQRGKWHEIPAKYPQRTPFQFTKALSEAGVDFDIIGIQMYFAKRPVADCIAQMERFKIFNKTVHLAEVGAASFGTTREFIDKKPLDHSRLPYEWRRHWDEELQADWLETIFSYAYSRPFIEAANWYDFIDPFGFLQNGGLLRSPKGEKKSAVDRLLKLKAEWDRLPGTL